MEKIDTKNEYIRYKAYKILELIHNADAKKAIINLNIIRNALGGKEYQKRLEEIENNSATPIDKCDCS